jgi:PAS domain S-box-containing protein
LPRKRQRNDPRHPLTDLLHAIFDKAKSRSQERQALSKQHRLAERYRVLVENAPVCIHEIDRQRTLSAVNRAGMKMLGRTESIFGVPVLSVVAPPERLRISRLLDLAFTGEFCEFEFQTIDGRTFLSCFMPLKADDGTVRKLLGMSQDITHRKNAEKRLSQALKMDALGKFASGIAHDFNNTLSAIIAYADLLQEQSTPEKVKERAGEIVKVARHGSALAGQLLAFGRKQATDPHAVNLNAIIENTGKMLRRLIGKDVELCLHLAKEVPAITAEEGQTEQIIINLAVNGSDAMPSGGRLLIATSKIDLDHRQASSVSLAAGPYVVLTVSDNGHGMGPEVQARMFEPFFTTKQTGTGIGLATVHAIVMQHGGHIAVESRLGEGTTFTIYLPAVAASIAAAC